MPMRWVEARGLVAETTLDARDLWRARSVREGLRALALANKTTGAILTVDGGNIAAALR